MDADEWKKLTEMLNGREEAGNETRKLDENYHVPLWKAVTGCGLLISLTITATSWTSDLRAATADRLTHEFARNWCRETEKLNTGWKAADVDEVEYHIRK